MSRVVEVRGLRYHYGDGTRALNGVDFHLEAGESVALMGANGSGKTTFAMHLNGLLTGEGTVRICGMDMAKANLAAIRRKVGMVFQDAESQLFMPTVLEDVTFGLLNLGMSREKAVERAHSVLENLGIAALADKAPYHLSAGEKRRAAIAGVVAMEPEILVLDEPTTFLDPPGQKSLAELLATLPQAKILVTHDSGFARLLCRRAVFFQDGQIAADGAIDEITSRYGWNLAWEASNGY